MQTHKINKLKAPICCVLGHVDTGKTKLLDKIRGTCIQSNEVGGITQQMGATYVPISKINDMTQHFKNLIQFKLPGIIFIDTPGHEAFSNMRSLGTSFCDFALLVVDIVHGIEPQTIDSINLLKQHKIPFIVAINKVDRLYKWKSSSITQIDEIIEGQTNDVKHEFTQRVNKIICDFAEQSLNVKLFYKNDNPKQYVSLVPTSAITGDGIADLLYLITHLTQLRLTSKLLFNENITQCVIFEVKKIEGFGTCIDVVLINGILHENDLVVTSGLNGAIITNIKALLIPDELSDLRIKAQFQKCHHINASQCIRVVGSFDGAIAGSKLIVCNDDKRIDTIKEQVQESIKAIQSNITNIGVCVQASTLGSLNALLCFLKTSGVPVSHINIGNIHKKDILRASIMMNNVETQKYACILAFNVKIKQEVQLLANQLGVKIFHAEIIYNLFDAFTKYLEDTQVEIKNKKIIYPCILRIIPQCVFTKKDPIIVGVKVINGTIFNGTPLCIPTKNFISIGTVASIEINNKTIGSAQKNEEVSIKIEPNIGHQKFMYGRHFDDSDELVSEMTYDDLKMLKEKLGEKINQDDINLLGKFKYEIFKW